MKYINEADVRAKEKELKDKKTENIKKEAVNVTVPLGLWMFKRPGELRLNHNNVIFNYFF